MRKPFEGLVTAIAHDSGAAEFVAAWLLESGTPFVASTAGPAKEVFENSFGSFENLTIQESVKKGEWVLAGSGWQTDFEKRGVSVALSSNKPVVYCMDHWTNFRERLWFDGNLISPDIIWLTDDLARSRFGDEVSESFCTEVVGNRHLDKMIREIKAEQRGHAKLPNGGKSVLILTENTSQHAQRQYGDPRYWGYTEREALTFFLDNIVVLGSDSLMHITVRPHPSENLKKYQSIVQEYSDLPLTVRRNRNLVSELARHDVIVGCHTIGMVMASRAGKRVICSLPVTTDKFCLPREGIEMLSDLVTASRKPGGTTVVGC